MNLRFLFFFASLLLVACGGQLAPIDDAGTSNDAGTNDGSIPRGCSACTSSQYCQLDKTCGSNQGTCVPRPSACPDLYSPACGTDGKTYPNECEAHAAGVDVSEKGGCHEPQGWVACGPAFCEGSMFYCQASTNDVAGPGQPCGYYNCEPLPAECKGQTSCSCFMANTPCPCDYDGNGFKVTCPGG